MITIHNSNLKKIDQISNKFFTMISLNGFFLEFLDSYLPWEKYIELSQASVCGEERNDSFENSSSRLIPNTFCSCCSNIILVCPRKHSPVLVKLDGQHFSLPNGGEVIQHFNVFIKVIFLNISKMLIIN